MQSEELQELTASEPLALDQEYEMQGALSSWSLYFVLIDKLGTTEKWRIDEDSTRVCYVLP